MSPSPAPLLRSNGSCFAASAAPATSAALPTFTDAQGRFLDRLSVRPRPLPWVSGLWAIHKPCALRSKTIDFAQVRARYQRWEAQGRPPSGEVALQFEHAARKFQRALDDAPPSAKRMQNHEQTGLLLKELHDVRQAAQRLRATDRRHRSDRRAALPLPGRLAELLASCFGWCHRRARRAALRQREAEVRRIYLPPRTRSA